MRHTFSFRFKMSVTMKKATYSEKLILFIPVLIYRYFAVGDFDQTVTSFSSALPGLPKS